MTDYVSFRVHSSHISDVRALSAKLSYGYEHEEEPYFTCVSRISASSAPFYGGDKSIFPSPFFFPPNPNGRSWTLSWRDIFFVSFGGNWTLILWHHRSWFPKLDRLGEKNEQILQFTLGHNSHRGGKNNTNKQQFANLKIIQTKSLPGQPFFLAKEWHLPAPLSIWHRSKQPRKKSLAYTGSRLLLAERQTTSRKGHSNLCPLASLAMWEFLVSNIPRIKPITISIQQSLLALFWGESDCLWWCQR